MIVRIVGWEFDYRMLLEGLFDVLDRMMIDHMIGHKLKRKDYFI